MLRSKWFLIVISLLAIVSCQKKERVRITVDAQTTRFNGIEVQEGPGYSENSTDLSELGDSVRAEFQRMSRENSQQDDYFAVLKVDNHVPYARLSSVISVVYANGFPVIKLASQQEVELRLPPGNYDWLMEKILTKKEIENLPMGDRLSPPPDFRKRAVAAAAARQRAVEEQGKGYDPHSRLWLDSNGIFFFGASDSGGHLIRNRYGRYDVQRLGDMALDTSYILHVTKYLPSGSFIQAVDAITSSGTRTCTFTLGDGIDFKLSRIGTVSLEIPDPGRSNDADTAVVRRLFERHAPQLDSIYNKALQQTPVISGIMDIHIRLNPSGDLPQISSGGWWIRGFQKDVLEEIKKWAFPKPRSNRQIYFRIHFIQQVDPNIGG